MYLYFLYYFLNISLGNDKYKLFDNQKLLILVIISGALMNVTLSQRKYKNEK